MATPLRAVIERHGLVTKKSLGQHFLLDENLLARIVRCAGTLAGRHVVEIGPGPGGLTRALLATGAASVTAIEIDPRAAVAIRELDDPRLTLIEADALAIDAATLAPAPRQIVANLPYNVASPLLVRWLQQAAEWERLTLMFQREVAERLIAAPSTPAYGRLSILTQATCQASIALRIPAAAFWPPPKVESAVVSLTPHAQQPAPKLRAALEQVTATAFNQRRKMLRTSLKPLGGETLLARACIAATRRAETLTVAECLALAESVLDRQT